MFLRTADTGVKIALMNDNKIGTPGDNVTARLKFNFPLAVHPGILYKTNFKD